MRRICPAVLLAAGCMTSNFGVGVLHPRMEVERFENEKSDRDPTADFNRQPQNPWVPERSAPAPGSRSAQVQRAAATIAAIIAGATPALVWSGTFDENRLFVKAPPAPATPSPRP